MNVLKSKFIKGVISIGIGLVCRRLFGLLSMIVVVRAIPREQFGILVLMEIVILFFLMMGDLGLTLSSAKFIASTEERDQKESIIFSVLSFRFIVTSLVCLAAFLSRDLVFLIFKSRLFAEVAVYLPVLIFLSSFNEIFCYILQGLHLYRKSANAQILTGLSNLLSVLIFVVIFKFEVRGVLYGWIISLAFSILYQVRAMSIKRPFNVDKAVLKRILKFGFPLQLNSVLSYIFMRADTMMIGFFAGPVSVAYYGAAAKIPDSLRQMFDAFRMVYYPTMSNLFSKNDLNQAGKVLNNSLRLISFGTIFTSFVIALFQKEIVSLLFSERYLSCAPALLVLMIALNIFITNVVLGIAMISAGHPEMVLKINIVTTAVNVAANLALIPAYSFVGAAAASVITHYAVNPINIWMLRKTGIRVSVADYMKPIALFVICLVLFWVSPFRDIMWFRFSLMILFLSLSAFLKMVKKEDLHIVVETLGLRRVTEDVVIERSPE